MYIVNLIHFLNHSLNYFFQCDVIGSLKSFQSSFPNAARTDEHNNFSVKLRHQTQGLCITHQ